MIWTEAKARKVARYHASNAGCTPFSLDRFTPKTWRQHLESDWHQMSGSGRPRQPCEVEAVASFLLQESATQQQRGRD